MSGYVPCNCRDCFDIAISDGRIFTRHEDDGTEHGRDVLVRDDDEAMCFECIEHDCGLGERECKRPDAYATEDK